MGAKEDDQPENKNKKTHAPSGASAAVEAIRGREASRRLDAAGGEACTLRAVDRGAYWAAGMEPR
jgi:hypothetical protein